MLDECFWKIIKYGWGSIMVWGFFVGGRIGKLVIIDAKMMKHKQSLGTISPTSKVKVF